MNKMEGKRHPSKPDFNLLMQISRSEKTKNQQLFLHLILLKIEVI